jgi:hypothetical protein
VSNFADIPCRVGAVNVMESLWIHPGTEPAAEVDDGGEPYADGAYVPTRERRRLADDEIASVSTSWHWPSSHCVSTFALDAAIVEEMRQPRLSAGAATPPFEAAAEGERLWKRLCDYVPVTSIGPVAWLGLSERPSGLRTSTFDIGCGRRLGLHLDSWDRMPLHHRHLARVRLCVNLGEGPRSLLFLPYDIKTIADAVEANGIAAINARLGSQFCAAFPHVPVFEVVVPPGHAYLAPTDNLIHDSCSEPSPTSDVTMAWLGLIGLAARIAE